MFTAVQTLSFQRGRLPHWLVSGHAYFVTLCRKGCIPMRVVAELREEQQSLRSGRTEVARDLRDRATRSTDTLVEQRRRFLKIEALLDADSRSERDLCTPETSEVVLNNLNWLGERGWRIWAATLMPSHAHLVMANTAGNSGSLRTDLGRFMAFSAKEINRARGTTGGFWQREPFDHWCRDADAWLRSVSYTVQNPVKAGLCKSWREWPHTTVDPEVAALLN